MEGARRRVTQLQRKIQQETGGLAVSGAGSAPGGGLRAPRRPGTERGGEAGAAQAPGVP